MKRSIRNSILTKITCSLVASSMLLLSACGMTEHKMNVGSTGNMVIKYTQPFLLERAPYYEVKDDKLVMTFNGREWYYVTAISDDDLETTLEGAELLGSSANMEAYYAEGIGSEVDDCFCFAYVLEMKDSDGESLIFYSGDGPNESGYGNDFDVNIAFYDNGIQVVPDLSFDLVESE